MDRIIKLLGLALWLAVLAIPAYAQGGAPSRPSPLVLTEAQGQYPLGLHLELLEDKEKTWTIEEVTSPELARQFVPSQEQVPNFSYTDSAYWVRFRVRNEAGPASGWRLEQGFANTHYITLYAPRPDGAGYEVKRSGILLPPQARDVPYPTPVFELSLPSGTEQTIYLRFETGATMTISLTLWSVVAFDAKSQVELLIIGLFYGSLLIMLGYNLFLLLSLRDKSYAYYLLFVLCGVLGAASFDGVGSQYLWPGLVSWQRIAVLIFIAAGMLAALKFTVTFLNTRTHVPNWHKFISLLQLVWVLLLISPLFFRGGFVAGPIIALLPPSYLIMASIGFTLWRRGYRPASYYLLAMMALVVTIVLQSLARFDLVPSNPFTDRGFQVGFVLLVWLLSVALADRINSIKQERAAAQADLLRQQAESLRLKDKFSQTLQRAKEALEERVVERTSELSRANASLQAEIAERRQTEAALQSEKQLSDDIINSLPGVFYLHNDQAQLVRWNKRLEAVTGYSPQELRHKPVVDFFDVEERALIARSVDKIFTEGTAEVEGNLVTKAGQRIPYYFTGLRLTLENKFHFIGLGLDISQRKQAEAKLQQYRDHLEQMVAVRTADLQAEITERQQVEVALRQEKQVSDDIINSLPGIFYLYDDQVRLTRWNKQHEVVTGYSTEELQDKNGLDFFEGEDRALVVRELKKVFAEGVAEAEVDLVTKAGEKIPYYLTALRTTLGDKPYFVGFGLDISKRKQTEEELKQYQDSLEQMVASRTAELQAEIAERQRAEAALYEAKEAAEAANRAKSIFLANMSHELRTPLNTILGYTQLLDRELAVGPGQQEHLKTIARSGEHLLTLIDDVLEMSRIEAGRETLNTQSFDLYRLVGELVDMFHLRALDKHLELSFRSAPELPRTVKTDPRKLRQVLINLLSNAIKFTEQGSVTVRVGVRDQGSGVRGQESKPLIPSPQSLTPLYFEIADSGIGIKPDEMATLFDPFVQAEAGQKLQRGTGLGLAITRQLVQLLGGELTVHSDGVPGHGSTFRVDIPVLAAAAVESIPKTTGRRVVSLAAGQPPFRILVAEDNPESRHVLAQLLAAVRFDVREAEDGQAAVQVWEEWQPQLIWMDLRMPGLDGMQATRQIKARPGGQAVVIVALTASAFEEERVAILAGGCDDYLCKPFHEAEIFEIIRKHLGVRYVYAAEVTGLAAAQKEAIELKPSTLAELPLDLLNRLEYVTVRSDMAEIARIITELQTHVEPVAQSLARLAHNFEYRRIVDLIQAAKTSREREVEKGL